MVIEVWKEAVPEATTPLLGGTIKDEAGVATQPTTITKTVLNKSDLAEITSPTSILADVTAGVLAHPLTVAETTMQDATLDAEKHWVLLIWTWGSGRVGSKIVEFTVKNLPTVP